MAADDLNVRYAAMTDAARQLRDGETTLDQTVTGLATLITNLTTEGYVTSESSIAYAQTFEDYKKNLGTAIGALEGLASFLEQAAKAFGDVDTSLKTAISSNS